MTQGLRTQIARLEQALPTLPEADKRGAAIGSWAAMVGAVILSRAIDDPELSQEILDQTRDWIDGNVGQHMR